MGTPPVNNSSITSAFMQGMDLETALMMVQSKRVDLLDQQLKGQLEAVEKRNSQIEKLNQTLTLIGSLLGYFGTDDQGKNLEDATDGNEDASAKASLNALIKNLQDNEMMDAGGNLVISRDSSGNVTSKIDFFYNNLGSCTHGELNSLQTKIKGMIDAQSNSQQMDMLRLQSLSNKRNEAYDLMSNFVKKMQDGRSSIIANMR
jgi:hypothetical protein